MSEAQELNVLTGAEETITVGGRTLVVHRIRMRNLSKVMSLVQPLAGYFTNRKATGSGANTEERSATDITMMLVSHGPFLVELVSEVMTSKDQEVTVDWINDLELDEVAALAGRVLEVNLDFFIQKVIPALSTALGSLNAGIRLNLPAGTIPSQP